MFSLTRNLRRYAVRNFGVAEDATEKKFREVIGQKLIKGSITVAELDRINAGKSPDGGGGGTGTGKKAGGKKAPTKPARRKAAGADRDDPEPRRRPAKGKSRLSRLLDAKLAKLGITPRSGDVNPASAFTKATRIRVKEAAEGYSTTKKGATYPEFKGSGDRKTVHPWAGQPVRVADKGTGAGEMLDHPSDRDKAVAAAWMKWMVNRSPITRNTDMPRWTRMTDHDRELLLYAIHNEKWVGSFGSADEGGAAWVKRKKLNEWQVKTLLDDSTSGGIEITPVVFDDALILTPVLYGELFPFIRVENVARGRRVKGGQMINPSFTSGVGEGTAITPFNTSSFVTAFDTAIYPAVAAIELGQDFEEDSPVDLGGQIVEQFGLKALEWLDRVVAVGTGYNEPQGIFNASGVTLVNSTFGAGGPYTVSDFEGLMFGVEKKFRSEAGAFNAFVSNDYTYRKARGIPVGQNDQRRVFGMDHMKYQLLDFPHKIQQDIPDGRAAFGNLRRYRMYRRLGMQVRVETGGRQLALTNNRLIVIRMRYGGQPEIGSAFAVMNDLFAG